MTVVIVQVRDEKGNWTDVYVSSSRARAERERERLAVHKTLARLVVAR